MRKKREVTDRLKVSEIPEETPQEIIETPEAPQPEPIPEPEPEPEEETTPEPEEETTPETEEPTPGEPAEVTAEEDKFNELLGKIEGAEAPPKPKRERKPIIENTKRKKKKGESSPESFRVEGYILMLLVDTVYPFAFATLNNMLDKRIKIESSQLQLEDKDFKKLEPLADQAADYMAVNLNPIAGFFLVATFMYGNNIITLRMRLENESPKI